MKRARELAASLGSFVALGALCLSAGSPSLAHAEGGPASATMPLEQVLSLHQQLDDARKPADAPPPVQATIDRLELTGRLYDGGVDLSADVTVRVLASGEWVSVELLQMDADTSVAALPELSDGSILARDGRLSFLTRTAGSYRFTLALRKRARAQGLQRSIQLQVGSATLAVLKVVLDEDLFRLDAADAVRTSDGVQLYPREGRFALRWERRAEVAPEAALDAGRRPPVEPIVPTAQASLVSTLEGQQILRLRYALRFEGSRPIEVTVPEELHLDKVLLNGALQPFELQGQRLSLQLTPARAGDQAGVLELVLTRARASFNLSGDLRLRLPTVSWPVHELLVRLHLPEVFNYAWAGGSLSPLPEGVDLPAMHFSQELPEPGKVLAFRQVLVGAAAPDLRVGYTIDLEGQYFRGQR